jgi:hypothetical protein
MSNTKQDEFDRTIGRLDRVLSEMMGYARGAQSRQNEGVNTFDAIMDEPNQQTLKHHAEDMVAAGHAILKLLGKEVQATPQPKEGIMYE